jgi:hypothetical protein
MVRIAISVEAFEAIARTLPLSSVGYENEANERGERRRRRRTSAGQAKITDVTNDTFTQQHLIPYMREHAEETKDWDSRSAVN